MNKTMALLLSDTYKQCHDRMYPKGLTKLVSYWVPRKSMLEKQNKMVFFGLQAFIGEYLMEYFQKNFLNCLKRKCLIYIQRLWISRLEEKTMILRKS